MRAGLIGGGPMRGGPVRGGLLVGWSGWGCGAAG